MSSLGRRRSGELLALQGRLRGVQDTTMRLKQYELEEAQIWQAQLAHAEQRVADYYAQAEEDAGLEAALRHAEAREKEMQKVRSSDLYLEWQRLFSSHLRAGGTLQDFSTEVFLKEVHNVVPQSELMAKENAMTEMEEEISMMKMRLQNIEDTEREAAAESAEQAAKCRMLRADLQDQQSTNAGWRDGRLRDSVHKLKLREEQDQHQGKAMKLEEELKQCEEEQRNAAAKAQLFRNSAVQMHKQVQPCEARCRMLEAKMHRIAGGSAELQQRVEMQEFELGRHKLLQVWGNEANQASRIGQEHQHEALALLRHSALVRADEQNAEQELQRLWTKMGEIHQEAAIQKAALSRTCQLREAVEKDVLGLRETNAFLEQQRLRTQRELQYAEGVVGSPRLRAKLGLPVPMLKLPETFAGNARAQVSRRSSAQSGAL